MPSRQLLTLVDPDANVLGDATMRLRRAGGSSLCNRLQTKDTFRKVHALNDIDEPAAFLQK
jgi:hypothetical protein